MRINAVMAVSLEVRGGKIDMWIGTTAWNDRAHTWVEHINAGGDYVQQAITLIDDRNQRWPVTLDLNEHPVFARERGAAQPTALEETLAERAREAKAKRKESARKARDTMRENLLRYSQPEQNPDRGTNRGLGEFSGRTGEFEPTIPFDDDSVFCSS
jgi:hypothetical protein